MIGFNGGGDWSWQGICALVAGIDGGQFDRTTGGGGDGGGGERRVWQGLSQAEHIVHSTPAGDGTLDITSSLLAVINSEPASCREDYKEDATKKKMRQH